MTRDLLSIPKLVSLGIITCKCQCDEPIRIYVYYSEIIGTSKWITRAIKVNEAWAVLLGAPFGRIAMWQAKLERFKITVTLNHIDAQVCGSFTLKSIHKA